MDHRLPLESVWYVTVRGVPRRVVESGVEPSREPAKLRHSQDLRLVRAAIKGSPRAIRRLVARLTPVIRARCGRVLLRSSFRCGRDVQQQLDDMTQEVFLALFDRECRELSRWDPERGASLDNFIGVIAHRQTLALLRTGRRNPWYEEPVDDGDFPELSDKGPAPDETTIRRDLLERVVAELEQTLSAQAHSMFQLLILEARSVSEVCEQTGLSSDAVYAWRSRLLKRVRQLALLYETETDHVGDARSGGTKR